MVEITNIKLGNKIIILWNGKIKKNSTGKGEITQAMFPNVTDDLGRPR